MESWSDYLAIQAELVHQCENFTFAVCLGTVQIMLHGSAQRFAFTSA